MRPPPSRTALVQLAPGMHACLGKEDTCATCQHMGDILDGKCGMCFHPVPSGWMSCLRSSCQVCGGIIPNSAFAAAIPPLSKRHVTSTSIPTGLHPGHAKLRRAPQPLGSGSHGHVGQFQSGCHEKRNGTPEWYSPAWAFLGMPNETTRQASG